MADNSYKGESGKKASSTGSLVVHHGIVVDANGNPVAGAAITVIESPVPMPEIAWVTDAAGRFRIALTPGRHVLSANAREGAGEAVIHEPHEAEIVISVVK